MNDTNPATRVAGGGSQYYFGPFRLDLAGRKLWRGDETVHLTGRVFETLAVLVRHADQVVTKEELVKAIWPDSFVTDDSLTQCIWSVRRVLGDEASQPQFVVTVPRQGYRFIAPITITEKPLDVSEAATEAAPSTPLLSPAPSPSPAAGVADQPSALDARVTESRPPRRWNRAVIGAATVVAASLGLIAVTFTGSRMADVPLGTIRTVMELPAGTRALSDAVLSPDSRQVVFAAQDEANGRTRLWLRTLSSGETRPLTGTEGASRPFWSPRSDAVGFFASGRLKIAGLSASEIRTLADVGLNPGGAAWNREGGILFAVARTGLKLVSADGGPITSVTTLEGQRGDQGHRWPHFLPDGRHFLYTIASRDSHRTGTYIGSLDGGPTTRLFDTPNTFATYVDSGHILYLRNNTLVAQPFDLGSLRPRGTGRAVASGVSSPDVLNGVAISATSGLLTLRSGRVGGRLIWFSRAGAQLATVDTPVALHNLSLSPDGRELLADTNNQNDGVLDGVWRLDLVRGTSTRLGMGSSPLWSPDGRQIALAVAKQSAPDLYLASATAGSEHQLLLQTPDPKGLADWSRDGRYIVYRSNLHLWVLPLFGPREPSPFLQTPFDELQARISPDGRWLAYASNESGRWEVYVQSFPAAGTKHVVSTAGGAEPLWRGDGRELFFVAPDNTLMSMAVTPGASWQSAEPQPLFKAPLNGELMLFRSRYQVSPDGSRILMDVTDDPNEQEVSLVINWLPAFD
jgi:eukaryotic-like serine/threonine-protein kinase